MAAMCDHVVLSNRFSNLARLTFFLVCLLCTRSVAHQLPSIASPSRAHFPPNSRTSSGCWVRALSYAKKGSGVVCALAVGPDVHLTFRAAYIARSRLHFAHKGLMDRKRGIEIDQGLRIAGCRPVARPASM